MSTTDRVDIPIRLRPKQTLEMRYPIKYRDPSRVPVQLIIKGNALRIRFFVSYSKEFMRCFPGTDLTYADIFEAGVRSNWAGKFNIDWLLDDGYELAKAKASFRGLTDENFPKKTDVTPQSAAVRVAVEFVRKDKPEAKEIYNQHRFIKIVFSKSKNMPSHVVSPIWRRFWGVFSNGQLEALMLNWSVLHPGNMYIQRNLSRHLFQKTGAHEVGHILGIGDAYAASYRFYYEAPGTTHYMMSHNRKVQPQEIEMAVAAHFFNQMQFFPRRFILKTFTNGMSRSLRLKINHLSKSDRKQYRVSKN
mgnify:FL=1